MSIEQFETFLLIFITGISLLGLSVLIGICWFIVFDVFKMVKATYKPSKTPTNAPGSTNRYNSIPTFTKLPRLRKRK